MSYVYRIRGRVDSNNAEEVEQELLALHEKHGELSIDADDLVYISSAGLRVLLKLRKMQEELEVKNVSQDINEIFTITGFSDMFTVKKK